MGNGAGTKLKRLYDATYELLTEKWITSHEEAKASRLERFAHFWVLVFKSFSRNRCPLRATALAYTFLLALVPILALAVSITSGLLQERGQETTRQLIERFVDAVVPQLKMVPQSPDQTVDARTEVVENIHRFIANIQTRTLGVTGVLGLIITAILLMSTIEDTFNDIWGVTRGRYWSRRLVQYWTTISLGPIVLVAGVVLASSAYLKSTEQFLQAWPLLAKFLFKGLPFVLVSCAFALLYKLMPNTQVHWGAAFIGGVVGGSIWLLLNIFNAFFMGRVASLTRLYGTAGLSLIPIFLLGLYFSWFIVLFGAQVAYAFQNRLVYVQEKKAESVSQRGREYVALRVMTFLAHRYEYNAAPPTLLEIANELGVPSRLVGRVLQPLLDARLVLEITGNDPAFAPGRPLETISYHDILTVLRTGSGPELQTRDDASRELVCAEFDRIQDAERATASAVTLRHMVERLGPPGSPGPANPERPIPS